MTTKKQQDLAAELLFDANASLRRALFLLFTEYPEFFDAGFKGKSPKEIFKEVNPFLTALKTCLEAEETKRRDEFSAAFKEQTEMNPWWDCSNMTEEEQQVAMNTYNKFYDEYMKEFHPTLDQLYDNETDSTKTPHVRDTDSNKE